MKKKITAKLVKVMEEVSHVQKNGRNEYLKYQYATAADVLKKINEALCKNKICSVTKANLVSLEKVTNSKGNQENLATVRMDIRLIDSESGEYVDIVGLGSGQDGGDKGIMKAATASIKYAYMTAFCISTGDICTSTWDDPEADIRTDQFMEETPNAPPKPRAVSRNTAKSSAVVCVDCGKPITAKVQDFSLKRYGTCLCMDCQKNHKAV
ncbi:MAG: ERF family protein [Anaerovibrio sp.]|nr:ERF family protein [Anaerovibrio sp.]